MKVKNLTNAPMQLGDGKMIGASGHGDERDYDLKELTGRDQQRFERGQLQVSKSLPDDAETTEKEPSESKNLSDGKQVKKGEKNNAK